MSEPRESGLRISLETSFLSPPTRLPSGHHLMTSSHNAAGGPKYIQDFSKALAGEVKILLAEVGKLRDEKRALQFEIAELMSIKAKHSAEGVYAPGWHPPPAIEAPPPPAEPAPPAAPAPGGWRTVYVPPPHVPRAARKALKAPHPAPAPAPLPPPAPNMPAWAQWRPNPHLAPTGPSAPPAPAPPPRSGLFGPKTPPPK
ncbi:hypothetical protein FB45DRAFT_932549 [Roridomyces roridus]|uniref:Uncharacterized protein n=1 Tax=Roridomyces roridus TaxID=1738132 RepID=A0AAD7FFV7_9AGAR|nr:hypothetical protein FB45DRAFT_932549 [Roridomyces roridus]